MTYTDKNKKHPIVRALLKKGYSDFEIAYSSKKKSDYGWTCINAKCDLFGVLLGFTVKDCINKISKL
jgi:hypothetical protein